MQIGVIGINHKLADVELREAIAKACQRRFQLNNPVDGSSVLLSTCNRTELYFSSKTLVETHQEILYLLKSELVIDFEQKLYTFFGIDCFSHLAKVTSGLDSAIVRETEIQGQVKSAYQAASSYQLLSSDLHFLFQKSLHIAKRLRRDFPITKGIPDLEHALLLSAREFFGDNLPPPLFIGASEINLKIARFFKSKGIHELYFCNRSSTIQHYIETECNGSFLPWHVLEQGWMRFSWVIAATKCPHYLLHAQPIQEKKLLIDLSVPRNIDPNLQQEEVSLLNIDDLQGLLERRNEALEQSLQHAEASISENVLRLAASFHAHKQNRALPLVV